MQPKPRRRSVSVSRLGQVAEDRRRPHFSFEPEDDLATKISAEIAKAIMMNPEVNLGVFLKTSSNAKRDLCKSDATIIITSAILEHIGNARMAKDLLKKSSTCSRYYEDLGLDKPNLREMFVTLLLALNPIFSRMIEIATKTAIDQLSVFTKGTYSESQIIKAIETAHKDKSFDNNEVRTIVSDEMGLTTNLRTRRASIQRTPTEYVGPDDSVSMIGKNYSPPREMVQERRISQDDMLEYMKRKKRGIEPEFKEVFSSARAPVTPQPMSVLTQVSRRDIPITTHVDRMNKVLGANKIKKYDISTGQYELRTPQVEDFLDSESLSASVLEEPRPAESSFTSAYFPDKKRKPLATETYLPDTVIIEEPKKVVKRMDSLEALQQSLNNLGL